MERSRSNSSQGKTSNGHQNIHLQMLKVNNQNQQNVGHYLDEMITYMKVITKTTDDAELLKLLDVKEDPVSAFTELGICMTKCIQPAIFYKEPYNAVPWSTLVYLSSRSLVSEECRQKMMDFLENAEVQGELQLILTYFLELRKVEKTRFESVPFQTTFSLLELPLLEKEMKQYLQQELAEIVHEYWLLFQYEINNCPPSLEGESPRFEKKLRIMTLFQLFGRIGDHLCLHGLPYHIQSFFEEMKHLIHSEQYKTILERLLWNPQNQTLIEYYERQQEEITTYLLELIEYVHRDHNHQPFHYQSTGSTKYQPHHPDYHHLLADNEIAESKEGHPNHSGHVDKRQRLSEAHHAQHSYHHDQRWSLLKIIEQLEIAGEEEAEEKEVDRMATPQTPNTIFNAERKGKMLTIIENIFKMMEMITTRLPTPATSEKSMRLSGESPSSPTTSRYSFSRSRSNSMPPRFLSVPTMVTLFLYENYIESALQELLTLGKEMDGSFMTFYEDLCHYLCLTLPSSLPIKFKSNEVIEQEGLESTFTRPQTIIEEIFNMDYLYSHLFALSKNANPPHYALDKFTDSSKSDHYTVNSMWKIHQSFYLSQQLKIENFLVGKTSTSSSHLIHYPSPRHHGISPRVHENIKTLSECLTQINHHLQHL